jgi:hypothetical protein
MSKRLAFHDMLTLSPSDDELLAFVPRPVLALVLVIPAPDGYAVRLREVEEKDVKPHDKKGDEEDAVFYHQTIGNACGLYAILHAVSNGEARGFVGEFLPPLFPFLLSLSLFPPNTHTPTHRLPMLFFIRYGTWKEVLCNATRREYADRSVYIWLTTRAEHAHRAPH